MLTCKYCGWSGGYHDSHCPPPYSLAMAIWERGYLEGKSGKFSSVSEESEDFYRLGWQRGKEARKSEQKEILRCWASL